MKISIVELDNKTFAIQKTTLFGSKSYMDLCRSGYNYWWKRGHRFFVDCQSPNVEKVTEVLANRWAKPVKTIQTI